MVATSDSPEHSSLVSGGVRAANRMREEYIASISSGEVSFSDAVSLSTFEDYKALSKIKLLDILSAKQGWSESTAIESLKHSGFDLKDNILSIRRSQKKIERFEFILNRVEPGQWRVRPRMPKGWPWRGKIAILANESMADPTPLEDIEYDVEVNHQTGEVVESATPKPSSDDLDGLFDGPDEDQDDIDGLFQR